MAKLPDSGCPTLAAADAAMVAAQDDKPRAYLGMSAVGGPCRRRLWLGLRWAAAQRFDAATLKRFEDGHQGEALQATRLRLVPGLQVWTENEDGEQFGYADHGGHLRGHMDGAVLGLVQSPKTPHVWEHKQVGEKKFKELAKLRAGNEKTALVQWDTTYHAQAQLYMHYSGMERHYLTCSTPGGRETIAVRTEYNAGIAEKHRATSLAIIIAPEPPEKVSTDPTFYICKMCPFAELCHGAQLPAANCRTCAHSTPELDGDARWSCAKWKADIPLDGQRNGCDEHRWIPALAAPHLELVESDGEAVTWRTPAGGEIEQPPWKSSEIYRIGIEMATDRGLREIKHAFPDSTVGDPMSNLEIDKLEAEFQIEKAAIPY